MANNIFSFFSKNKQNSSVVEQLVSLMQWLPSAACLLDKQGDIVFANNRFSAICGWETASLTGTNISKFGLTLPEIKTLFGADAPAKLCKDLVNKDLDAVRVNIGAVPVPEAEYVLLTFDEVPYVQENKSEKAFSSSLLENYPFAVFLQDRRGVCLTCNKQAEKLFSLQASSVLGRAVRDVLPRELIGALDVLEQDVKKNKQSCQAQQMTFKSAQGTEVFLNVLKVPSFDAEGNLESILTIFEDLTSRKKEEDELFQKRNLLEAIVENMPLGMYTRNVKREVTFYNKQAWSILSEMSIKYSDKPNPKQDSSVSEQYAARERQALEEDKVIDIPEEVYVDSSGNEHLLHVIKVPIKRPGIDPVILTLVEDVTDKKDREREITKANSFLSAIIDNAPIGLYARTRKGKMLLRNKKSEEILGASEDQFDDQGSLPNETEEQVVNYLNREAQVLESGKPLFIPEEEYEGIAGNKRLLQMVKVPVTDAEGSPEFVITMVEDITEKKEQEEKLINANNLQQALLEHAPLAIYARGVDRNISFCNRRAQFLFGTDMYEDEYLPYMDRERQMFENGDVLDLPEEDIVTCDGKKRLFHLVKAPIYDKEKKPLVALTIAEDVTEKKQQERELIKSKEFLQKVVDNLPVALSVKDHEGKYIVWNKKSEDLFGVHAKDVIGKTNYRTDITQEQAEFMRDADNRVFASGKEQNIAQELISTPTEGVKIMHTVKTPLFTPEGQPDYLLNVSEDITSKTKMEKQIREASEKNTLLVENAREGILILEDERVIYCNRAACQALGFESQEELVRKKFLDFVEKDHQMFAREKYECVLNVLEGADAPTQLPFVKKDGEQVELELSAMASKYLGRRIVIAFLRDVTLGNRNLREARGEREKYKHIFELGRHAGLVLNPKGYISVMNKAAREMFYFTEKDRTFYTNVYVRPALTLEVRRQISKGACAQMDYVFDFDKAAAQFPGRIHGEGKLHLHLSFVPFNRRDSKDGSVEADYLVTLEPKADSSVNPPAPPAMALPTKEDKKSVPPPAPAAVVLPNTEPHVICSNQFKITSCNDLFCQLCQLGKEELQGQEIIKLFAQSSIAPLVEDLKALRKTGGFENHDYEIHVASGLEKVPVRVNVMSLKDGNYAFVFKNMSSQKQIMQVLQERTAQLNALLTATDGAIFSVHYEDRRFGRILQANKFLSDLIGYSHDELVGMRFLQLFADPKGKNKEEVLSFFTKTARTLDHEGIVRFVTKIFNKEGHSVDAAVCLTPLDIPGQNVVLALITDLSEVLSRLAQDSKEALELRSMRQILPGLYLKTNAEGLVKEATSNLSYLSTEECQALFLDKRPLQYWPEEIAQKALVAIKEAVSVNINTTFEFEWEIQGKKGYFEALCTPISGRNEVVLWVKDVTDRHNHEKDIRELSALSNENSGNITEQVDRILTFGKRVFKADVGFVARFNESEKKEMTIVYSTPSPFQIERYMVFPVEECLFDVKDDNVVVFADLATTHCKRCIHKEKKFGSMIAAPLYVGGKVAGTLCFASAEPRSRFEEGAEELLGIMSRILSLRIELREASKTLGETSQSFVRTLEYVDLPAVVLDLKYHVTYANAVFLSSTGRHQRTALNKEFFKEFIRNADDSREMFESFKNSASGHAFQVKLDLVDERGKYAAANWDVFLIKDIKGAVEGYGLIGVRQ